jgi:hypothetical protein
VATQIKRLLSIADVAALAGVPVGAARRMHYAGKLPKPIEIGRGRRRRHQRWRLADIERFLGVAGAVS